MMWAAVSAGIGYWAYKLEQRLLVKLEKERDKLVKRRMMRLEKDDEF